MRIALDRPLLLTEIAGAIGGKTKGNAKINRIVTDSREIRPNDLFVALRGKNADGEQYIGEAEKRGGYGLGRNSKRGIVVEDGGLALLRLANYYKKMLTSLKRTVAITGSVGKTTTKEFLRELCETQYKVHANEGNQNNHIGVPLTILSAPAETEIMILEMGMNAKGEIAVLSRCAEPDVGVITNIGTAHIGLLGSRKAIAEAKEEIREGLRGTLAVPYGERLLKGDVSFSATDQRADVYVGGTEDGIICRRHGSARFGATFSIKGVHMRSCLSAAICAASVIGIDERHLKAGVSQLSDDILRQRYISIGKITLLSDYYNASLESVLAGLELLRNEEGYEFKSALIGDILELGDMSADIHARLGVAAQESRLSRLYLFGKEVEHTKRAAIECGFPSSDIFHNPYVDLPTRTAEQIISNAKSGELIFCKASRGTRLERVVEYLSDNQDKLI